MFHPSSQYFKVSKQVLNYTHCLIMFQKTLWRAALMEVQTLQIFSTKLCLTQIILLVTPSLTGAATVAR